MSEIERKTKELNRQIHSAVLTKEWLERAIISLGLYGRVSGVVGKFLIYNIHGKMFIRLRPKDFKMSQTAASVANRKNMAAATKFAKFLNNIDVIKRVWKKANAAGVNSFSRLIKYNKKHLINDYPSRSNILTPNGNDLYIENIVSAEKNGKIKVNNDYNFSSNEKLVTVMVAYEPVDKGYSGFECLELYNSHASAGEEIKFSKSKKAVCRNYKKYIIYSALISENGKKIHWSNTSVLEGTFDFGESVNYELAEAFGYGQILSGISYKTSIPVEELLVVKPPG